MSKNSLAILIRNVDSQLCELVSSLICSICQEILNEPVTTRCRHSFCSGCIEKVLSTTVNSGCPLCKNPIERTSLHSYKAKLTLSKICQELPAAFSSDVKDLRNFSNESVEDLIRASKLTQLTCRENLWQKKKCSKILSPDNEMETFVPILKRTTKVIQYKNRKKKKLDELVSVSQTEVASNSSTCDSMELDKKLGGIEKVPALEKVKEWFRTVGDNIFHNSPASSPVDYFTMKNVLEQNPDPRSEMQVTNMEKNNNKPSSMIRIDYIKSTSSKLNDKTPKEASDPYEFVPSQNNQLPKRKKKPSNGNKRKIPGFRALQNYSKETIERNAFLKSGRTEQNVEKVQESSVGNGRQMKEMAEEKSQPVVTASQKFSKLLAETKSNEKENSNAGQALFSEFSLRLSSGGGNSKKRKKIDESVRSDSDSEVASLKSHSDSPPKLFSDVKDSFKEKDENRFSKRRQKSNGRTRKNTFSDIMELKSEDALELEKSMEGYLKEIKICKKISATEEEANFERNDETSKKETPNFKSTELLGLLEELINDELIYRNRTENAPVVLPKKSFHKNDDDKTFEIPMPDDLDENLSEGGYECATNRKQYFDCFSKTDNSEPLEFSNSKQVTQLSGVIGFPTQTELPEGKILKNLIENMEKELNSADFNLNQDLLEGENCSKKNSTYSRDGDGLKDRKRSDHVVPFSLMGKFKRNKTVSVNFLQLGRLTPTLRRSRSSVVKLMFPTGFSSCAGRQAMSKRCAVGVQTSQTSPKHACCSSQISSELFASNQTFGKEVSMACQKVKTSVEIQTSQEFILGVGTGMSPVENPSKECKSMQTSQVPLESVEVQTVEFPKVTFSIGNQTCRSLMNADSVTEMNSGEANVPISDVDMVDRSEIPEMEKTFVSKPLPPSICGNGKKRIRPFELNNSNNKSNQVKQTEMAETFFTESNATDLKKNNLGPLTQENKHDAMESRERENPLEKFPIALNAAKRRKKNSPSSSSPKSNANRRQLISINVEKIRGKHELTVPEKEIGNEAQSMTVLNNVDQNPMKNEGRRKSVDEFEKSEESDSDFFVEQTPPKPKYSIIEESSRQSRSRIENGRRDSPSLERDCFIDDSGPKIAAETETRNESQKKNEVETEGEKWRSLAKGSPLPCIVEPFSLPVRESDENDQNRMNANESEDNRRVKGDAKKSGNVREKRKFVIVASSVKNQETIAKFVREFNMEFSTKPTKEMTHLIVGLHENEDGDMLPLCTPKLLFAMANKKWIVSESWAENSLKSKCLLPENSFETRDAVGGSGCRRARLSEDPLLNDFEICLLGNFARISKEELASLISDAGGTLVSKPNDFSFSSKTRLIVADKDDLKMDAKEIQRVYDRFRTVVLSWDVIIMFIQSQKLCEFSPYMLHSACKEDLIGNGYPIDLIGEEGIWKRID